MANPFVNRIIGYGTKAADQFEANPLLERMNEMWYNTGVVDLKIVGRSDACNILRPDTRKGKFLMQPHRTLNAHSAQEVWKSVVGFEGKYEVSDLGRVRRIGNGRGSKSGRVLCPAKQNSGYLFVSLYSNNVSRQFLVHRLVAEVFIGPIPSKFEVNHLDGNKMNNCSSNLEIVTRAENRQHGIDTGLISVVGEDNPQSKLTAKQVLEIRALHSSGWGGYKALAARFGVTWGGIRAIVKRHTWRHL